LEPSGQTSFFLALTLVVPQVSYASDVIDQDPKQSPQPVYEVEPFYDEFQDALPGDIMKLIFIELSENGVDPRGLELVCKHWHNSMGSSLSKCNNPEKGVFGHAYTTKRNDFFMEDCLRRYWGSPLNGLTLTYTDPETQVVKHMKTSGSEHTLKGTFDLSECGKTSKYLRITTSVEEFLKVGNENKDRVVVLVSTHGLINGLHADKFKDACDRWNPEVASVGLFWRWGDRVIRTKDDYGCQLLPASGMISEGAIAQFLRTHGHRQIYENMVMGGCSVANMFFVTTSGYYDAWVRNFTFHF